MKTYYIKVHEQVGVVMAVNAESDELAVDAVQHGYGERLDYTEQHEGINFIDTGNILENFKEKEVE